MDIAPQKAKFLGNRKGKTKNKLQNADIIDHIDNPDRLRSRFLEHLKDSSWSEVKLIYWVRAATLVKLKPIDGVLAIFQAYLAPEKEHQALLVQFDFSQQNSSPSSSISLILPLKDIRKISHADNSTDFVAQTDVDLTWRLSNQIERDEAVWILIQSCKIIPSYSGGSTSVSYLVVRGVDASYSADVQGIETRFPSLFALFLEHAGKIGLENFISSQNNDDREAENLLEELSATDGSDGISNSGSPAAIQQRLQDDLYTINIEICDLLLQWEADDKSNFDSGSTAGKKHSDPTSCQLQDTVELLSTLNQVDYELSIVDNWLGEQIDYLSVVQAEIQLIEAENGTLETSWQNLSSVQQLVHSVLSNLQVSTVDEEIILRAEKSIRTIFSSPQAQISDIKQVADPLASALESLRRAICADEDTMGCSKSDWEQIKFISGVSAQRKQLSSLSSTYCSSIGDTLPNLFSLVLKHKCLNSPHSQGIIISKFSFNAVSAEVHSYSLGRSWSSETTIFGSENQILFAQISYHNLIGLFFPIIKHTIALNSSFLSRIRLGYIETTQQLLYTPLIRQLCKEAAVSIVSHSVVSFATIPKTKANKTSSDHLSPVPLFIFRHKAEADSKMYISSVPDVLLMIIVLVSPVIIAEERALKDFFGDSIDRGATVASLDEAVDELFSNFKDRVTKIINYIDSGSLEIIGILVLVEALLQNSNPKYKSISDSNLRGYFFPQSLVLPRFVLRVLEESKQMLLTRLDQFVNEEINWIQSGKGGISDSKLLGIFPAICKFPFFIDQLEELTIGQSFEFSDQAIFQIGRALLNWTYATAANNEKYQDAALIQNLSFFEVAISSRSAYGVYQSLLPLVTESRIRRLDAEARYLDWMISYEIPIFSSLFVRISGVEKRANRDELALYVRRQEVIKVISSFDIKSADASISALRKRLEKHFMSNETLELHLVPHIWVSLRDRMSAMLASMEDAIQASYQLSFTVSVANIFSMFEKYDLKR